MLFVMIPRANVSAKRINEVLMTKTKIHFPEKLEVKPSSKPCVEFKHVSFSYNNSDGKILENISFKAEVGKTTAFIGSTGSGKSTFLKILLNPELADRGEIDILKDTKI